MENEVEELIEIEKVAKMLKVTNRTVRNHAAAGELPAYKIGNLLRFKLADVLAFMERSRYRPGKK